MFAVFHRKLTIVALQNFQMTENVTFFYFLTIFQFLSVGRMWRPVCTESEWRAALRKAYFQCCVFSPTYVYVQTRAAEQGAIASPPQYF